MHGEGIAMAIYGLAEAECWEPATWKMLAEQMKAHSYDYELVKQSAWDATQFKTLSGNEHLSEASLTEFGRDLFFKGNTPTIFLIPFFTL